MPCVSVNLLEFLISDVYINPSKWIQEEKRKTNELICGSFIFDDSSEEELREEK